MKYLKLVYLILINTKSLYFRSITNAAEHGGWAWIVCSSENSASLNFCIQNSSNTTASRYVFAKKQILLEGTFNCQFEWKFCLFEFLYRELLTRKPLLDINLQKSKFYSKRLWIVCSLKILPLWIFVSRTQASPLSSFYNAAAFKLLFVMYYEIS